MSHYLSLPTVAVVCENSPLVTKTEIEPLTLPEATVSCARYHSCDNGRILLFLSHLKSFSN